MSASWGNIENALVAWVKAQTGFATGQVLWANSNASRPAGEFVSLQLTDVTPITAADEVQAIDHTGDLVAPDAGAEIEMAVQARRQFGLSLQCFAPAGPIAVPRSATAPRAILEALSASLALPSVKAGFEAVGVSCYSKGATQDIPALVGANFEGRAILDLRFYVVNGLSEFTTYIGTVDASGVDPGPLSGMSAEATID